MTNNDIIRRIRYIFDFSDTHMIKLFALGGQEVSREQESAWLQKEDDPAYQAMSDTQLAVFLNGMIVDERGKREGPQPEPEKKINNNLVFKKLRIALSLKDEDILEILERVELGMSKHELSAFFRKPGHKNYRECKDQVLRNFLKGLQQKYRPGSPEPSPWKRALEKIKGT